MRSLLVFPLLTVLTAGACGSNDPPPAAQRGPVHDGTETEDDESSADESSTGEARERHSADPAGPHPTRDGLFAADGSPDPRACQHADDCHGDTVPDVRQPCCNDPRTLEAFNTSYRRWVQRWRTEHCADVRCPRPPPPSLPERCHFEMRCVEGRCADSCE